ncbi:OLIGOPEPTIDE TRANSPORTER-RELATED [Salix viminalis]|uniref:OLIGOPEPTIDE TRANSPORTER-RELATED n=1 Tax=Salix viminalis TaxID=40686 RepID=A0A9Q0T659_SALVM|nr:OLIGOPEPTIDE TRANSPORTER-RELATED [Salix viminalis]
MEDMTKVVADTLLRRPLFAFPFSTHIFLFNGKNKRKLSIAAMDSVDPSTNAALKVTGESVISTENVALNRIRTEEEQEIANNKRTHYLEELWRVECCKHLASKSMPGYTSFLWSGKWTGTVYMCSLIGAFLSDSYWGRYLTCAVFQLILVSGLVLVSVSSWFFLIKPDGCGDGELACVPTSSAGVAVFYLAIYLVAFGYGGHQPSIATFGSAVLALVSFLFGTPGYQHVKPCGNPLPRVAQVFVAAVKKWNVIPAKADELYEVEGPESAIKGSRKILHSDDFDHPCFSSGSDYRSGHFVKANPHWNKAATVTEDDLCHQKNPWRLCTISQVEEAKCVLKMLPIWLCTIIYSVVFTQMASLFVEQGDVMNSYVGKFHLPAASMSAFDICSVLVCTGIYRQILVPLAGRLSGNTRGLTELQRMGIGLIIGMLAMLAAGATEIERLRHVTEGEKASSLSIFWQIPQYVLVGASEVFMYVGQLEFFNGQAPDGIKSLGSSLCMASISLGNYVSSMLVNMVMKITTTALTALDFVIYLFCANWYKPITIDDSHKGNRDGESSRR